jgi:hypothetical protein
MPRTIALTAARVLFVVCSAHAQTVNIWLGVAPGSESWTQKERTVADTPLGTVVFNVVTPTLTAFLPERSKATGTGAIAAPGGAFVALAIDLEGNGDVLIHERRGIAIRYLVAMLALVGLGFLTVSAWPVGVLGNR